MADPTRLTALEIIPTNEFIEQGTIFGFPPLTQDQINLIPEAKLTPGIGIYNTDTQTYMVYLGSNDNTGPGSRWANINASLTYKAVGLEAGAPFAFPAGNSTDVEVEANQDQGFAYYAQDLEAVRTYIVGTGWVDVVSGGGGGGTTFTNITVTDLAQLENITSDGNTQLNNLTVDLDTQLGNVTIGTSPALNGLLTVYGTSVLDTTIVSANSALSGTVGTSPYPFTTPALNGPVVGSGATMTITGSAQSGQIVLNSGTGTVGAGQIAQFTMASILPTGMYAGQFGICVTPGTSSAASLLPYARTLSLGSGNTPATWALDCVNDITTSTSYTFNYVIIGNI